MEDDKQIVIINNIQPPAQEPLELRTISLYGDITEQKGAEVTAALLYLESTSLTSALKDPEDPESEIVLVARPINMYISTHGGVASDMFSILDVMESVKTNACDIHTFGIGKVMSAGVPILAAGTKGKRSSLRHSRIMIHQPLGGARGQASDIRIQADEILFLKERLNVELSERTGQDLDKVKEDTDRDFYMSPSEAVDYGLIDLVLNKKPVPGS